MNKKISAHRLYLRAGLCAVSCGLLLAGAGFSRLQDASLTVAQAEPYAQAAQAEQVLPNGALGNSQGSRGNDAPDDSEKMQQIQKQIEESNARYEEVANKLKTLKDNIAANQGRIAELEKELPEQREKASSSLRVLYKIQQGSKGLLDLIMSAHDFNEFVATMQYLGIIQSKNTDEVAKLAQMAQELSSTQAQLNHELEQTQKEETAQKEALQAAIDARTKLQEEMEARAAAEAAAIQEAIRQAQELAAQRAQVEAQQKAQEEAKRAQEQGQAGDQATERNGKGPSFKTETGAEAPVEVPTNRTPSKINWSSDKRAFVDEWTARLTRYLAGSPLANYGHVFAEAAWDYGVDPRFSAAISTIESSTGRYCFRPHNAWGWGSVSWDNWETAIRDHTRGLANGYGGRLTLAGARKYCPPTYTLWYSSVLAQMEKI